MTEPLPLPIDALQPHELERLRPLLLRLKWERHVNDRYTELFERRGLSSPAAIDRIAEEETEAGYPVTRWTIERVIWPRPRTRTRRANRHPNAGHEAPAAP